MKSAIVVFSGGPDSTAAVLWALASGYKVKLLTFQFKGDEQNSELLASMEIARLLSLKQSIIDFKAPLLSFQKDIVILMHADTTQTRDKSKSHRLQFGAGVILSTAAAYANYNGYDTVIWGATKDDLSSGRYEYSQEFADGVAELVSKCTGAPFKILVPFAEQHKYEVLQQFIGREDLFAATWSCKASGAIQDGSTPSCVARRVAAQMAGIEDRTKYMKRDFISPFTPEQIADPTRLSAEEIGSILGSEKPDPFPKLDQ